MIEKRHTCLTEEMMRKETRWGAYNSVTLNLRQHLMDAEVPRLGHQAALSAVKDWGRPTSAITHLIFCCSGGASMPGADYHLLRSMGLPPTTKRFMLYQVGCFGGGTVLRLAKDVAENNPGARVLAVCSEVTAIGFRGPCEAHIENLVGQAIFGDGASAVVVGTPPFVGGETEIFELVSATQQLIPGSDGNIVGHLREEGLMFTLQPEIPHNISNNVECILKDGFRLVGMVPWPQWNSLFWVVHPGGRAILDKMEEKLGLSTEKLRATREVLRKYGNMWSACVFFVMEEMRQQSAKEGKKTAGEGGEWGVVFAFGPGLTAEMVVLRCPLKEMA